MPNNNPHGYNQYTKRNRDSGSSSEKSASTPKKSHGGSDHTSGEADKVREAGRNDRESSQDAR